MISFTAIYNQIYALIKKIYKLYKVICLSLANGSELSWVRLDGKLLPAFLNNENSAEGLQHVTEVKLTNLLNALNIYYFIAEEGYLGKVINICSDDANEFYKALVRDAKAYCVWNYLGLNWVCIDFVYVLRPKIMKANQLKIGPVSYNKSAILGVEAAVRLDIWEKNDKVFLNRNKRALVNEMPSDNWLNPKKEISRVVTNNWRKINFEIDAIYTWVDSGDSEWAVQKDEYLKRELKDGPLLVSSASPERYENEDELKYSLRSLWSYANFFRKIFIVTCGHYPSWLNIDHPKIELISHDQFFKNKDDLPTFNSHAIEANLHHIKDLKEHFVYFNDDVFLGRVINPEFFFDPNGCSKMYFSATANIPHHKATDELIPTDKAGQNLQSIISSLFGFHVDRKMSHVPFALNKHILYELEDKLHDLFQQTSSSRFRNPNDLAIPSMLFHYYGWSKGSVIRSKFSKNEYVYVNTGKPNMSVQVNRIAKHRPLFYCLNSTLNEDVNPEQQKVLMRKLLEKMNPIASPFEKHT